MNRNLNVQFRAAVTAEPAQARMQLAQLLDLMDQYQSADEAAGIVYLDEKGAGLPPLNHHG